MLKFKNLLCCTMSVILMLSLMSCSVVEKLNSHYEGDLVIDQTENVSVSETVIKALENNDADAIKNLFSWSPNGLNNPNSGGTLFKIWKTFRIDFEAGKQLFHTHITYNLYNSMPKFMRSMKRIFDPAKRDVHVRLTSILGGVIGVTQKE